MNRPALPPRDEDPILTLYAHYYLSAELMFENYQKLLARWQQKNSLSQNNSVSYRIYLATWLGFLAVTAEGFTGLSMSKLIQNCRPVDFAELLPQCEVMGKLLEQHGAELKRFRNNVFHLRKSPDIQLSFLTAPNRIEWAEKLQGSFKEFFSGYRVLCEVHYALQSNIHRKQLH